MGRTWSASKVLVTAGGASNGCARATYGDSGHVPDPRDLLDASGPCP